MSSPSFNPEKSALRDQFRRARQSLSDEERINRNQHINKGLLEFAHSEQPAKIGAYLAFDGEPDIGASLNTLAKAGAEVFLPVLTGPPPSGTFEFRHWMGPGAGRVTELTTNAFGVREPQHGGLCELAKLDLVLMPLVAWDETGNRIGMGGGYYDRVLAAFAGESSPRRVGIAYSMQRADRIPASSHDVRLHQVLTEDRLFTFAT